jgi:hypothetical protein
MRTAAVPGRFGSLAVSARPLLLDLSSDAISYDDGGCCSIRVSRSRTLSLAN